MRPFVRAHANTVIHRLTQAVIHRRDRWICRRTSAEWNRRDSFRTGDDAADREAANASESHEPRRD
jgi:hypothetical protein